MKSPKSWGGIRFWTIQKKIFCFVQKRFGFRIKKLTNFFDDLLLHQLRNIKNHVEVSWKFIPTVWSYYQRRPFQCLRLNRNSCARNLRTRPSYKYCQQVVLPSALVSRAPICKRIDKSFALFFVNICTGSKELKHASELMSHLPSTNFPTEMKKWNWCRRNNRFRAWASRCRKCEHISSFRLQIQLRFGFCCLGATILPNVYV